MSDICPESMEKLVFAGESITIKLDFWFDSDHFDDQEEVDEAISFCQTGEFAFWVQEAADALVASAMHEFTSTYSDSPVANLEKPLGITMSADITYGGPND
tara:strand:- start:756 stop:1058 length:303 start_codon:yes stop_codon:yes gene_type:complete